MRSIRNAKEVSIARNDKGNELTRRTDAEGNLKVLDCGTLDIGGEVAGRDGRAMAGEEKVFTVVGHLGLEVLDQFLIDGADKCEELNPQSSNLRKHGTDHGLVRRRGKAGLVVGSPPAKDVEEEEAIPCRGSRLIAQGTRRQLRSTPRRTKGEERDDKEELLHPLEELHVFPTRIRHPANAAFPADRYGPFSPELVVGEDVLDDGAHVMPGVARVLQERTSHGPISRVVVKGTIRGKIPLRRVKEELFQALFNLENKGPNHVHNVVKIDLSAVWKDCRPAHEIFCIKGQRVAGC